jgi:ribonuclease D
MAVICDTPTLDAFCSRLSQASFVTVDTEFMRERTYWPQLCLIQLAGPDEAAAVDALAEGIDLAPVFALMEDRRILKVFHAARQDLEIFHHLSGRLPDPLFDTQVAAMVCGFGDQAGYDTLVKKLTNQRIDKSSRFTDWAHRPLTDKQIDYALADVTHLRQVYEKLNGQLGANGRRRWLEEELGVLTDAGTYAGDPRQAWSKIKSKSVKPRFLAVLREVAAWRESQAQERDLPRGRVLRDEALVEIAHHAPETVEDLARTRGLGRKQAEGEAGRGLLAAVADGLAVPEGDCPRPTIKEPLPRGLGPVTDLLKVLLKMKCDEHDVAQKLLASSADIERIAAEGEAARVPALSGWRRQVFGQDALDLRAGNLALVINTKKLELVELEDEADG